MTHAEVYNMMIRKAFNANEDFLTAELINTVVDQNLLSTTELNALNVIFHVHFDLDLAIATIRLLCQQDKEEDDFTQVQIGTIALFHTLKLTDQFVEFLKKHARFKSLNLKKLISENISKN